MKRGWKIFWSVCVITGGIGIVCLVAALGMGVTLERIDSELPYGISIGTFETENSYEDIQEDGIDWENADAGNVYEDITGLDVDLTAGELKIYVHDNDKIVVETEGISKKLNLQFYKDGNELVMTSEKSLSGIVNQSIGTIYIYLPKNMSLDHVKLQVHAGTLYIEEIIADNLSINVGAGEADISSFSAKEADFDCGAGKINVYGCVDDEIDIDCGMGSIICTLGDSEENYNYNINCGVGGITCGSYSFSGIGREQGIDNRAAKEMDIDCGVGEVIVRFEEIHEEYHEEHHEEQHF